ncbi:MAG: serine/threonine-protein kinase [Gemmataceae bacterium]|nr:serine/threonine-protein kinase [Gemmataceae bacterium]MCI0742704.1 serine/threonine-protein kinase [Gemmataceae bacterium]
MTQTHEQRLHEVLAEYLLAADSGQAPDRSTLLARYPDLATELESFFQNQEQVDRLADSMRLCKTVSDHPPGSLFQSRSFGDFEVLEIIGAGGMGVVYKARQISLNRIVALKMIRPGGRTPDDIERFLRAEAAVAANLEHPNIVPIYEMGGIEGGTFISLKFIEGLTLRQWIQDQHKADSPNDSAVQAQAVQILASVARAVHYAHERGILHRDLKPSNILLEAHQQPFVTDFGLAKHVLPSPAEESTTCTAGLSSAGQGEHDAEIVGTPLYMAPEQAAGVPQLTTAADIYSLGAILYEILTGTPPFRGDSLLATLRLAQHADPVRPRALNPRVDRDLEAICLKCLEKDPSRRYGSALALAEDLERWQAGEPIHARRVSSWERAWKWAKRRPATAALIALLILVPAAGFPVVTWLWQRAETARGTAEAALAAKLVALARSHWLAGDVEQAKQCLAECLPAYRDGAWRYLHRACNAQLLLLPHETRVKALRWHPDSKRLLCIGLGGLSTFWDMTSGTRLSTFSTHPGHLETGLVADQFAIGDDGKTLRVAVNASRIEPIQKAVTAIAVDEFDMDTGKLQGRRERIIPRAAFVFAMSPDARFLAVDANGVSEVWDAADGKVLLILDGAVNPVGNHFAFCKDSNHLARVVNQRHELEIWDMTSLKLIRRLPWPSAMSSCRTSQFAGRLLAWVEIGQKPQCIRVYDALAGKGVLSLTRDSTSNIESVALDRDGRRIAWCENIDTVIVTDVATGKELWKLRGHTGFVNGLAFSPDGNRLASCGADQTVRIWDVRPLDDD